MYKFRLFNFLSTEKNNTDKTKKARGYFLKSA